MRSRWTGGAACAAIVLCAVAPLGAEPAASDSVAAGAEPMVRIAGGRFRPLYGAGPKPERVDDFWLDVYAVANANYLRFVSAHPRWQRGQVPTLFADADYLRSWTSALVPGERAPLGAPVTSVSWFAARAYCAAEGKRLPTLLEWEYVARADTRAKDATKQPAFARKLLDWYGAPSRAPLPKVGTTERNVWGVWDLHGLIWEWVEDFSAVLMAGGSRKDQAGVDEQLFCAGGALGGVDPANYAAYMRYAMRSSVKANHTVQSMGFRCAKDGDER